MVAVFLSVSLLVCVLATVDNGTPTHFPCLISVAMKGTYDVNEPDLAGWGVTGVSVIASNNKGKYQQLLTISPPANDCSPLGRLNPAMITAASGVGDGDRDNDGRALSTKGNSGNDGVSPAVVSTDGLPVVAAPAVATPSAFGMVSDLATDRWLCLGEHSLAPTHCRVPETRVSAHFSTTLWYRLLKASVAACGFEWVHAGGGVSRLRAGVAAVPGGALFVEPVGGKLCFKDAKGVVHTLYA